MGRVIKRAFDFFAALFGLLVLSPVLLVVALLVLGNMGAPILFRQSRPGYQEKPITVLKFRTMRTAYGPNGELLPDAQRLTPFGKFMRRTSLDELPQLWNVLVGNLSLVGPRPLLLDYLPYYTDRERIRFSVRPGITGWAQVNGRNETSWDYRLAQDVWYVENWSLWLDFRILLLTARKVCSGGGVVTDPHSCMLNLDEERRDTPSSLSEGGGVQA